MFVEIGTIPNSYLLKDLVELNERNEVIVDEFQMTSEKGIFAAGDVTNQEDKQIIIAAAEGAKAALAITKYLNKFYKGE
jgi:alkyl hydroperoxide reductase subunit F